MGILRGSEREPLSGARRAGPSVATERIDVTLALRRRAFHAGYPDVMRLALLPPPERSYLSREEFARRYGADPEDVLQVERFARAHELEVGASSVGGRTIHLSGTATAMSRAFGVTLERWMHPGGSYRGRTGPISLPSELDGIVVGVFGLDDRPQARAHFRRRAASTPEDVEYTPPTVAQAYDFPAGTNGSGQTIGILELGGGFAQEDLSTYFAGLGLTVPPVSVVSIDGATNSPTGNPDSSDGEVDLDIEVAGSIAPGAHLVLYFAPNTDQGFLDGVTEAIHDTTHTPSVLSISWGGPESSWTAQARSALNSAIEDAATMGVTVTVAAGDDGATDGAAGGALSVDFPASSPYATGCGGTHLVLQGTAIESEVVWNDLSIGEGATGGGVSEAFALPSYQAGIGVPKAPNGFSGRGVPDVAGDADPTTGYEVRVDGSDLVEGGTSAVAPLWAALVARINQSLGVPLGFLNPSLYGSKERATFHSITVGNNDGYSAGPGWNPCAGWGSPDGSLLLQSLRSGAAAPDDPRRGRNGRRQPDAGSA